MRRHRRLGLLCALWLALPAMAQPPPTPTPAASASAPPSPAGAIELQAVTVSGVQPGPGLWKVSKGDHVLWVLGTLALLPEKMQWRAQEVQARLGEAQQVLAAPTVGVHPHLGFFGGLALLPSLIGVRNNPDGKKLREVVPPTDYAKWLVLKAKYLGRDGGVEKQRPIFAALALYLAAIKQAGLSDQVIEPTIKHALKQQGLKTTPVEYLIEVDNPRGLVKDFKRGELADRDCFAKTLDHLEGDIAVMRARANAWAVGDLDGLRALPMSDQMAACRDAVVASGVAQELGAATLPARLEDAWVAAAGKALEANRVSFALLPMSSLLGKDNYLARLQAQGDRVDLPDGLTPEPVPAASASAAR